MHIKQFCEQSKNTDKYVLVWFEGMYFYGEEASAGIPYKSIEIVSDFKGHVGYSLESEADTEYYPKEKIKCFIIRDGIHKNNLL